MWPATQLRLGILLRKGENYIGLKQSLLHHFFFLYIMFYSVTFCEWSILFDFAISFNK